MPEKDCTKQCFNFSERNYVTGGQCPSKATIKGKTVVITGANRGIGKETAQELAKRGVQKLFPSDLVQKGTILYTYFVITDPLLFPILRPQGVGSSWDAVTWSSARQQQRK